MAGKPGRSGGARPGTGGARPGAGRPPKDQPKITVDGEKDPLEFLLKVMNDNEAPAALRVRAAVAAAQYRHTKLGDGGKKEGKDRAAATAAAGKFAPAGAPRLVVNNR